MAQAGFPASLTRWYSTVQEALDLLKISLYCIKDTTLHRLNVKLLWRGMLPVGQNRVYTTIWIAPTTRTHRGVDDIRGRERQRWHRLSTRQQRSYSSPIPTDALRKERTRRMVSSPDRVGEREQIVRLDFACSCARRDAHPNPLLRTWVEKNRKGAGATERCDADLRCAHRRATAASELRIMRQSKSGSEIQ